MIDRRTKEEEEIVIEPEQLLESTKYAIFEL